MPAEAAPIRRGCQTRSASAQLLQVFRVSSAECPEGLGATGCFPREAHARTWAPSDTRSTFPSARHWQTHGVERVMTAVKHKAHQCPERNLYCGGRRGVAGGGVGGVGAGSSGRWNVLSGSLFTSSIIFA